MATRIFRTVNGIIAIERDGKLVFGPDKVYRAADVTVEEVKDEDWVVVKKELFSEKDISPEGIKTEIAAIRVEQIDANTYYQGVAYVFPLIKPPSVDEKIVSDLIIAKPDVILIPDSKE